MVVLSQIEEEKLLKDYSRISWGLVHRFSDGKGSSVFSQEDLYQECMLALVKHMKKCETKEELRHFHPVNLINAMTRFVLRGQTVRVDHNRTNKIRQIVESAPKKVSLSEVESLSNPQSEDDLIRRMDFERFMSSLPQLQRETLSLLGMGYTQTEAADSIGRAQSWVAASRKDAKRKYDAYLAS